MSDMDLVLLGSITRDRILASGRVMRHRRIPVIPAAGLRQSIFELCARLDVELAKRLAQVVLDGARADEQSSGDLSIGVSVRRKARNLGLLRGQLVERIHGSLAGTLACGQQLAFGAASERLGAHAGERR